MARVVGGGSSLGHGTQGLEPKRRRRLGVSIPVVARSCWDKVDIPRGQCC